MSWPGVPFEQCAQERYGCPLIAPCLDEDVEHLPVLVDGAPAGVRPPIDADEDRVERPRVTRLRAATTRRIGILLAERAAPLPDGLVGEDDAPLREQLLDVAVAECAAAVPPHRVGDDRRREPGAFIGGRCAHFFHALRIACGAVSRRPQLS